MNEDMFNRKRWVRDRSGRVGYLGANPHSVPGHFSVFWEDIDRTGSTALQDLAAISAPAHEWLQGFLSGNEPPPPGEGGGDLNERDLAIRRWVAELVKFHATGVWHSGRKCEMCGAPVLASEVGPVCEKHRSSSGRIWPRVSLARTAEADREET